jgi:hypothetical protein
MTERNDIGKWAMPGVPHKGWTCVGIEDLEEPSFTCEMCEVMIIRYVHTMAHPDYPQALDVGSICAGHMEEDTVGANLREIGFRSQQRRRWHWLRREWNVSARASEFVNTRDGFNVGVYGKNDGTWGARVEDLGTVAQRSSQWVYPTSDAAKLSAFTPCSACGRGADRGERILVTIEPS